MAEGSQLRDQRRLRGISVNYAEQPVGFAANVVHFNNEVPSQFPLDPKIPLLHIRHAEFGTNRRRESQAKIAAGQNPGAGCVAGIGMLET